MAVVAWIVGVSTAVVIAVIGVTIPAPAIVCYWVDGQTATSLACRWLIPGFVSLGEGLRGVFGFDEAQLLRRLILL